jgi:hypothetical protein
MEADGEREAGHEQATVAPSNGGRAEGRPEEALS